jgi:uncharacterized protein
MLGISAMYELFQAQADDSVAPLDPQDFDELDEILDEMRTRLDETPQWEFCEGFLVALLCARTPPLPDDYLPVLLGLPLEGEVGEDQGSFKDAAQLRRFAELWRRRWSEVRAALDASVQSLEDEDCYHPELMDERGALLGLPESEREGFRPQELPAFGQVWALGFMYAVESWDEDWQAPRERRLAQQQDSALACLAALAEDDLGEPAIAPFGEGPPSVSEDRVNDLAEALWGIYDLRAIARELGPRIATVHAPPKPGRNEVCNCGSGLKFKKCCGA